MRIEWAVACRYLEVHDNLATIVGAGIDRFTIGELPADVGVMVAARFAVAPGDDGDHVIIIRILNPDMDPIGELPGSFHVEGQPHMIPGWEGHHMIRVAVGFRAEVPGPHMITISVGGSTFEVPMIIELGQPPSGG